jgi:hypothetical protein
MSWFKRAKRIEDRFPPERLGSLPTLVALRFAKECSDRGLDRSAGLRSRFFGGYLLGFPDYVDQIDERFGGAIRKAIFDATFGREDGGSSFRKALANLSDGDEQTRRGRGAGMTDGRAFFQAVENAEDVDEPIGLKAMFDIGQVDLSQQL